MATTKWNDYSAEEPTLDVTEDFVESFKNESDFSGAFWGFMHYSKILPNGIDLNDPRVQAIIAQLDKWKLNHAS